MTKHKSLFQSLLFATITLLGIGVLPVSTPVSAQGNCASQYCVFIPSVFQKPDTPQLLYPADGEALSILAPVFKWHTPMPGRYRIQISETPDFSDLFDLDTTIRIRDENQTTAERIVNSNLDARKTYYWRVGIEEPLNSGNYKFSPTRSLTTPQRKENALLAPIPTPRAPSNNSIVPAGISQLVLTWDPVPGALYYRVNLDSADGNRVASVLVAAPATSATITNFVRGQNYTWSLKAANSYGWSSFSEPVRFRIPKD
jgi:hypothetical protein